MLMGAREEAEDEEEDVEEEEEEEEEQQQQQQHQHQQQLLQQCLTCPARTRALATRGSRVCGGAPSASTPPVAPLAWRGEPMRVGSTVTLRFGPTTLWCRMGRGPRSPGRAGLDLLVCFGSLGLVLIVIIFSVLNDTRIFSFILIMFVICLIVLHVLVYSDSVSLCVKVEAMDSSCDASLLLRLFGRWR